jgi:hypothetical protein
VDCRAMIWAIQSFSAWLNSVCYYIRDQHNDVLDYTLEMLWEGWGGGRGGWFEMMMWLRWWWDAYCICYEVSRHKRPARTLVFTVWEPTINMRTMQYCSSLHEQAWCFDKHHRKKIKHKITDILVNIRLSILLNIKWQNIIDQWL